MVAAAARSRSALVGSLSSDGVGGGKQSRDSAAERARDRGASGFEEIRVFGQVQIGRDAFGNGAALEELDLCPHEIKIELISRGDVALVDDIGRVAVDLDPGR